jgi:hypothetical protein
MVTLQHRLNSNLLRRWIAANEAQEPDAVAPLGKPLMIDAAGFAPLQLNLAETATSTQNIAVEIRHGAAMVTVRWRVSSPSSGVTATTPHLLSGGPTQSFTGSSLPGLPAWHRRGLPLLHDQSGLWILSPLILLWKRAFRP